MASRSALSHGLISLSKKINEYTHLQISRFSIHDLFECRLSADDESIFLHEYPILYQHDNVFWTALCPDERGLLRTAFPVKLKTDSGRLKDARVAIYPISPASSLSLSLSPLFSLFSLFLFPPLGGSIRILEKKSTGKPVPGCRPTVNTLTSLVPTSIDEFIFRTLLGATKITQCWTPAQSSSIDSFVLTLLFSNCFLSFFLGFRRPNLITGLSGWRAPN